MANKDSKRALGDYIPFLLLAASLSVLFFMDFWRWQWILGIAACVAAVHFHFLSPRYGFLVGLAWSFFALSGAWLGVNRDQIPTLVKWLSLQQSAFFVFTTLAVAALPRALFERLLDGFMLLCAGSAGVIVLRHFFGAHTNSLIGNAAADASFVAAMLPLLATRPCPWVRSLSPGTSMGLIGVSVAAIGLSGSSTAVAALALSAIAYVFAAHNEFDCEPVIQRSLFGVLILGIIVAALMVPFMAESFFNDNGRYRVWRISLNALFNDFQGIKGLEAMAGKYSPAWLFGAGGGTFLAYCGAIQSEGHPGLMQAFLFAHNEWLQVFFEYGIFGLALMLAVTIAALRRSFDKPWLFASLFTYGFVMLTQYPLRFFVPALFGACLVRETFDKSPDA